MNVYRPLFSPENPLADPLDALLAGIAINVQLPPGLHAKADRRSASICEHLGRKDSPLHGLIVRFYPQGSMAIDATISTRGTDDEYDLDLVIELLGTFGMTPSQVLDLLWEALKDYRGVEVVRQTRCVTLNYADGMHIDVTPSRRTPNKKDFEGVIFHANPERPSSRHIEVPMNAYAFAAWYNRLAPPEDRFSKAYASLSEGLELLAKADPIVHEVPEQVPLRRKSVTTVALQLIKRFRNVWSTGREGRYPPSVMLSCHAGRAASLGMSLSDMVIRQARWTAREIDQAAALGRLVDVRNPEMHEDRFTDRWPENPGQQTAFSAALHELANGLEWIRSSGAEAEDIQTWLRDRFGPLVVSKSFRDRFALQGRSLHVGTQRYTRSGTVFVPAAPAIVSTASIAPIVPARAHTNMGGRLK